MRSSRRLLGAALLGLACVFPLEARGQRVAGDGFLFKRPVGSYTLRGGIAQPSASSDVFDFARQHLTLDRGDFFSGSISADANVRLTERFDLQVSAGYSGRNVGTEFRDWVDNDDQSIEQSTALRRVPLVVGARYYLTAPGRSLGRLAWVPARVAPYVSAGGGAMWYQYKQTGDFVDFKTRDVFTTTLESDGWTPAAYGTVGMDYSIHPSVALNTEARYDVARARLSSDFAGFHRIDLSGLAVTAGATLRF